MIHQRKRIVPSRKEGDLSFDEQIDTWKIKQPAFEKESVPVIALIIKNSDDCTEKGLQLIICFVSYLICPVKINLKIMKSLRLLFGFARAVMCRVSAGSFLWISRSTRMPLWIGCFLS
jgi:hypothetical protein